MSNNIRLGAEVRLNSIYLRGGYGYYGKHGNQARIMKTSLTIPYPAE